MERTFDHEWKELSDILHSQPARFNKTQGQFGKEAWTVQDHAIQDDLRALQRKTFIFDDNFWHTRRGRMHTQMLIFKVLQHTLGPLTIVEITKEAPNKYKNSSGSTCQRSIGGTCRYTSSSTRWTRPSKRSTKPGYI